MLVKQLDSKHLRNKRKIIGNATWMTSVMITADKKLHVRRNTFLARNCAISSILQRSNIYTYIIQNILNIKICYIFTYLIILRETNILFSQVVIFPMAVIFSVVL